MHLVNLGRRDWAFDPKTEKLEPAKLTPYKAVCLLGVARPSSKLWSLLDRYVRAGGGLAVVPPGDASSRPAYNDDKTAQSLLPGSLTKVVHDDAGVS